MARKSEKNIPADEKLNGLQQEKNKKERNQKSQYM